ncbi:MAG: hypothetical protein ACRBDL_07645 [Alphaproteobacteria bacterium]
MKRIIFVVVVVACLSLSLLAEAKNEINLSEMMEVLRQEKTKAPDQKNQSEEEKRQIEEGAKWIMHENVSTLPYMPEKPFTMPKALVLDGKRYLPSHMADIFLDASFSDFLWYEGVNSGTRAMLLLKRKNEKIISTPKHNTINKWEEPVKITFKVLGNSFDEEKFDYLVNHLKGIIPIYSRATDLNISYVSEQFPDRSAANVFIVLDAESHILNAFKNQRGGSYADETDYEQAYSSAVRFTPRQRSQVEGFFIPNENNEIQAATCYLKPSVVPENWSKAFLSECLARALGVPEVTKNNNGILSNWNNKFDVVSAETVLDGGVHRESMREKWLLELEEKFSLYDSPLLVPSEFDLKILSILYCPSINPGMDKYEASLSLIRNTSCLEK